jgi:hypothetical protein
LHRSGAGWHPYCIELGVAASRASATIQRHPCWFGFVIADLAGLGRAQYKSRESRPRAAGDAMSEKPESEEYEDEDDEAVQGDEESLDVDRLMQDLDKRKRGAPRGSEPAWRKLERLLEQKRTSELLSDFDDYDIGDGARPSRPAK